LTEYRGARVLVTGHTGFKGAWLSRILNHAGAEVFGLSLKPEIGSLIDRAPGITFSDQVYIDIKDRNRVDAFINLTRPDLIFHLAAQTLVRQSYLEPLQTFETNVMGSANVLQSALDCQSVKGVVAVTTDKVYRNRETLEGYSEGDPLGGFDPYSSSKVANEMAVSAWQNLAKLWKSNAIIVAARAGNVIGGGDIATDRLMPDIVKALKAREQIVIRNPNSVRPWQHVIDPLFGYLSIGSQILRGRSVSRAYNFGPADSSKLSVLDIVQEACRIWPNNKGWALKSTDDEFHEASFLWLSSELAREELGWRSKLDAAEAVRWSLEWEINAEATSALEAMDQQIKLFGEKYL
jgi:CDP-glucose 4,6-dehydratase